MFNGIVLSRNDPILRSIHINIYNELHSRGSSLFKWFYFLILQLRKVENTFNIKTEKFL